MANTEISRVQKPHAGDYPLVPGFRCVCVVVPDDAGYVQLLNGFVSLLVKPYNWQGTFTDRGSRADLWAEAVAMTDFEGCTDCVQVADCIDTSEVVQSALSNWFVGAAGDTTSDVYGAIQQVYQSNVGGQAMPPSVSGRGLYDTGCVEDVVFGGVVYLIDQFDQNIIDAFEIAEELSNALERVKLLLSAIPVFETLPIDEVIDYAQQLWTDDLFEAYSAAVTTTYLNELKCDLFCIALDNGCTLSIDLLFHYFVTRVGGDPTSDLLQLIEYLTLGVWTGTQVPDTFFALQLIAMKLGNQFFTTIGIKSIVGYMAIGAHMPDSTWTEICDECPSEWDFVIDYETGENIEFCDIVTGIYEPGVGLHQDFIQLGNGYETIDLAFPTEIASRLTHYEIDADFSAGELDASGDATLYFKWGSTPETNITTPSIPTFPATWDGDVAGEGTLAVRLQIMTGVKLGLGDPGGTALLRRISLHGTGTPPA